jgi:hypothetical protein
MVENLEYIRAPINIKIVSADVKKETPLERVDQKMQEK